MKKLLLQGKFNQRLYTLPNLFKIARRQYPMLDVYNTVTILLKDTIVTKSARQIMPGILANYRNIRDSYFKINLTNY